MTRTSLRWSVRGWREPAFEALRPALPADGLVLLDSTARKARRAASGGAHGNAEAECLGRSRGGLCCKLHACADGAGRIPRLVPSPGRHPDPRHAPALVSGLPARDAALDRGYVPAKLRVASAADGCAVHTPPKLGMAGPPPWGRAILRPPPCREPVLTAEGRGAHRAPARQNAPELDGPCPPCRHRHQPPYRRVRSQALGALALQAKRASIARRTWNASDSGASTSAQRTTAPLGRPRTRRTPWARPMGSAPSRRLRCAGTSLPQTV